jgi:hypothetical protein
MSAEKPDRWDCRNMMAVFVLLNLPGYAIQAGGNTQINAGFFLQLRKYLIYPGQVRYEQ